MTIRVGTTVVDHPMAAKKDAGKGQSGGYKSEETPKCLGKPIEPAKMRLREPIQGLVGPFVARIKERGDGTKGLWKGKIDP